MPTFPLLIAAITHSPSLYLALTLSLLSLQEGLPPLQTIDEMQCMWFQTEMAMACHRLGRLGDALQKLHEIDKV